MPDDRPPLTRDDVEKVSLLARLILSDEELERMTTELQSIVGYVDQLAEVDTDGVEPMAHAVEVTNVLVADEARPSLPREVALKNAPNQNGRGYLVPAVLGE